MVRTTGFVPESHMERGDVFQTETVLLDFPLEVDQREGREVLVILTLVPLVEREGQENAPDHEQRLHHHAGNPGTPAQEAFGLGRPEVGQRALCWFEGS